MADGPFVNFMMRTKTLIRNVLTTVDDLTNKAETPQYGSNKSGAGKKIIIGAHVASVVDALADISPRRIQLS